jgi:hypothetical protein
MFVHQLSCELCCRSKHVAYKGEPYKSTGNRKHAVLFVLRFWIGFVSVDCCLCAKLANPSSDRCGQLYDKGNFGMVYRS